MRQRLPPHRTWFKLNKICSKWSIEIAFSQKNVNIGIYLSLYMKSGDWFGGTLPPCRTGRFGGLIASTGHALVFLPVARFILRTPTRHTGEKPSLETEPGSGLIVLAGRMVAHTETIAEGLGPRPASCSARLPNIFSRPVRSTPPAASLSARQAALVRASPAGTAETLSPATASPGMVRNRERAHMHGSGGAAFIPAPKDGACSEVDA